MTSQQSSDDARTGPPSAQRRGRWSRIRIAGVGFTLIGLLYLAATFLGMESPVWKGLILGIAHVALGVLLLVARAADTKHDTGTRITERQEQL